MAQQSQTMLVALLVVGLVIGGGIGYFAAPTSKTSQEPQQYTPPTPSYSSPDLNEIKQQLSSIITLIYGAIGVSLVAALATIVILMQISRRFS